MITIKTFPCNAFGENCYVVSDATKDCVLIDPGADSPAELKAITSYIEAEGLRPVHVLATHGHLDHNFADGELHAIYGLGVELHTLDQSQIESLDKQSMMFLRRPFAHKPAVVARYLDGGEAIPFGTHTITLLHTPGHTPGSIALSIEDEGVLFSGDTIFRMSIGRTDLPGGDYAKIEQSLRLLAALPHSTRVLTGHGPETTIGDEVAYNPYMR